MGEKKALCRYQQLQGVVQRSSGFCKAFSCWKGTLECLVWSGKQQGYKHCLEKALGILELVGRRAKAGPAQRLWKKGGCISPDNKGST